jgi:peroxiredoxin
MTIKVGDKVPSVTLKRLGANGLEDVDTGDLFRGRKVVMFSLPGAFTPTCSAEHLPGYVARADEIKAKGIDDIVCLAVNDPWVMTAWGEAHGAAGKVTMLPDGNGEFTKALGIDQDMSAPNLGVRGKRCSMIVEDGVVKSLDVEPAKGVSVSGADACLVHLR